MSLNSLFVGAIRGGAFTTGRETFNPVPFLANFLGNHETVHQGRVRLRLHGGEALLVNSGRVRGENESSAPEVIAYGKLVADGRVVSFDSDTSFILLVPGNGKERNAESDGESISVSAGNLLIINTDSRITASHLKITDIDRAVVFFYSSHSPSPEKLIEQLFAEIHFVAN